MAASSTPSAQLEAAVVGQVSEVLRFVVERQLRHIHQLDEHIAACVVQVAEQLRPLGAALTRLRTIPGVGRRTVEIILAEVVLAVDRFPTARHLAAWAGMCPGNRQSGGKPAQTPRGSPWLRAALAEAAWAARRGHHGYVSAHYPRLLARRGKKRAIVAVRHSSLVIAYYLLMRGTTCTDLGETWYDERDRQAVCKRTVERLEALGYRVHLEPVPQAA